MVDLDADAHQYRLDEIKELEAEVARLKENCYEQYKRIEKLETAFREIFSCWTYWQCRVIARAALPHPLDELREKKDG
jgi:predicted nuclease with TOPRIM domain